MSTGECIKPRCSPSTCTAANYVAPHRTAGQGSPGAARAVTRLMRLAPGASRTLASALAAMICFWTAPAQADLLVSSTFDHGNAGQVLRYDEHTGAFLDVFIDTFENRAAQPGAGR